MRTVATGHAARWLAFARLGKFGLVDHWLPAILAVCAVRPDARGLLALCLTALSVVLVASAGAALDDVRGFDEGLDQRTYAPGEQRRSYTTKPLLSGALDRVGALRFGAALAAGGIAVGASAVGAAQHRPWWAVVALAVIAFGAIQYSVGLSLSYAGFGEPFLGIGAGLTAVACAGFAIGTLPPPLAWLAGATACWMLAIVTCSAAADRAEDLAVGRRTMAGRLRPVDAPRVVGVAVVVGYTLAVVPVFAGILPPWTPAAFAVAFAIHIRQGRETRAGDWLAARATGWQAYRWALAAACAALLVDAG